MNNRVRPAMGQALVRIVGRVTLAGCLGVASWLIGYHAGPASAFQAEAEVSAPAPTPASRPAASIAALDPTAPPPAPADLPPTPHPTPSPVTKIAATALGPAPVAPPPEIVTPAPQVAQPAPLPATDPSATASAPTPPRTPSPATALTPVPTPSPRLAPAPDASPAPAPTPTVTPTPAPPSAAQNAVSWALAELRSADPSWSNELRRPWSGYCEAFVEIAYGTRHNYGSANANYQAQRAAGRIQTTVTPPPGALVFYSGGSYGHVALSIGGGQVITTWGHLGNRYNIRQMAVTGFAGTYLGWSLAPANWPGR